MGFDKTEVPMTVAQSQKELKDLAGLDTKYWKSSLLPFTHWPPDRLLALPGPFHVYKMFNELFSQIIRSFLRAL